MADLSSRQLCNVAYASIVESIAHDYALDPEAGREKRAELDEILTDPDAAARRFERENRQPKSTGTNELMAAMMLPQAGG